ncbi:pyridoxine biosynthesis amidotransferase [Thermococcus onnurineus NA1]|uniref:Pyridoxal 5'-phosphate synthase subunit PdxT n=1 Tax=Thermococcus onnurineus (strain NA1) TaxID=523850 RepID=PDXT_THEON|nr:pyridoxal 5'-phosphate synthase glutaminase subunit PdxT [Thermococcus onnurineus]B6YVQ8.1 RecName: Full=Pyridoxal 5'-phosphate synthase subunit PdxT; AltName: Full=Pdx2; AltName: Full=Pyridoxal 5'-phosphate synthase glutaminase subunit [Thermococcus onnurineus NA1]NJE45876.1 pyridoxal 5'-phosphate synthase glutaminase subunit PdxT [Thermococcus sp. GR7]NJE78767.1 pyridoxal 5'-phosphate synthase glutaminase subunit PdxT [Thermococcus sp. GR4]NJF22071.1 pyridoxal 5'-phosphate synthase glutami
MLRVGVIGVQGAVSEHIEAVKRAFERLGVEGEAFWLRRPEQLNAIDAIILPGGESTTISRLMQKNGLFEPVKKLGEEGLPIMGTCAGLILLAKEVEGAVEGQRFLELLDVRVNRNAYGRQVDSFEAPLKLSFSDEPFPGVFIRAPKIVELLNDKVKPIAWHGDEVVGVEQGNIIGLAFHPELTDDARLHEYFLRKAL